MDPLRQTPTLEYAERRALLERMLAAPTIQDAGHAVLDVVAGEEPLPHRPLVVRVSYARARHGAYDRLVTALRGTVAALEAAGADGEPGDMPAPALDEARTLLRALGELSDEDVRAPRGVCRCPDACGTDHDERPCDAGPLVAVIVKDERPWGGKAFVCEECAEAIVDAGHGRFAVDPVTQLTSALYAAGFLALRESTGGGCEWLRVLVPNGYRIGLTADGDGTLPRRPWDLWGAGYYAPDFAYDGEPKADAYGLDVAGVVRAVATWAAGEPA